MNRLSFILLFLISTSAHAAVCSVPGAYPNLQAAVNDGNCSDIQFGPGEFEGSVNISRSLTLTGSGSANTRLKGIVSVSGNGTVVNAQGFRVSGGCQGSWLVASAGGRLSGLDLISEWVEPSQCQLDDLMFDDGFESGF